MQGTERHSPSVGLPKARALVFVCLAVAAAHGVASAQTSIRARVAGDGTCPNPDAVVSALRALLPNLEVASAAENVPTVVVWSEGARYGVALGPLRRELRDAHGRCEDRARAVALIAAMALSPPSIALPTPKKAPSPTPVAAATIVPGPPPLPAVPTAAVSGARAPTPLVRARAAPSPTAPTPTPSLARSTTPRSVWYAALELSALVDLTPGSSGTSSSAGLGGALRLLVGSEWLHATISLGGVAPTTLDLGAARASLTSLPFDVGARLRRRFDRFEIAGEAGLAGRLVHASGVDVAASRAGTTIAVGVRGAIVSHVRIGSRWAPFLLVQAAFFPSPAEFSAAPRGLLGSAPRLYVGLGVGVAHRWP